MIKRRRDGQPIPYFRRRGAKFTLKMPPETEFLIPHQVSRETSSGTSSNRFMGSGKRFHVS